MAEGSTGKLRTVGLDLGDKSSVYVVMEGEEVLARGRVATTTAKLEAFFCGLEAARVMLEVGTHSPWVSRLAQRCGQEVVVLNARRLELVSKSLRKSDETDAARLAWLGQMPLEELQVVRHRSEAAQTDLELLRAREALVQTRTQLVNHVRGALKAAGLRVRGCDTRSFPKYAAEAIPEGQYWEYEPLLQTLIELSKQIARYDALVVQVAERYPAVAQLRQVPGVGVLTALTYVLTIDEPGRFRRSRKLGAYLGLTPIRRQSGQRDPRLGITHAGDRRLRMLLVQCAHYILGPHGGACDLRRWGLGLAERKGKLLAVTAVARKLAVLLHHLWMSGEVYQGLRQEEVLAA